MTPDEKQPPAPNFAESVVAGSVVGAIGAVCLIAQFGPGPQKAESVCRAHQGVAQITWLSMKPIAVCRDGSVQGLTSSQPASSRGTAKEKR